MTDRELLEAAAKAAGMAHINCWSERIRDYDSQHWNGPALHQEGFGGECNSWNPLTDDGDAFRLAVKLRIEVEPWIHGDSACARAAVGEVLIDEPHYGDDPERATRRAIVRAAAAMVAAPGIGAA